MLSSWKLEVESWNLPGNLLSPLKLDGQGLWLLQKPHASSSYSPQTSPLCWAGQNTSRAESGMTLERWGTSSTEPTGWKVTGSQGQAGPKAFAPRPEWYLRPLPSALLFLSLQHCPSPSQVLWWERTTTV